jgi:maltooligosyltrehalose trehalohydrolase
VRINRDKILPDPASLSQPEGVHGPSEALDPNAFEWTDQNWNGLNEENIFYELHTGTFSESGSFEGIEEKLQYLKDLGINSIEIMPVAQFPGDRNWGYDGVFIYAVQNSYGGASGLQRLVNRCHNNGIAVVLDVVYNHLGPEGNYLNEFGPYFTGDYKTPWGKAINFDAAWSDGVRRFFIENMLMWLRDFHLDGLRLDAIHAIKDFSALHIIKELRMNADALSEHTRRKYILIGEIDLNDTKYINSLETGGFGLNKQWCDEFHHSIHSLVTGERNGYYADFGDMWQLAKSFNCAYVYDGIWSPRRKRTFGNKTDNIPGDKFVVFTQNHDHIGNRMLGDRIGSLTNFRMLKLIAAAMFLSPYNALIFMGEEYNEKRPFLYFTSHSDEELIKLVSEGRKNEFSDFIGSDNFPEPQSEEVFTGSRLTFNIQGERKYIFEFYRELISLKKNHPLWKSYDRSDTKAVLKGEKAIFLSRQVRGKMLGAILNFDDKDIEFKIHDAEKIQYQIILNSEDKKWGGLDDNVDIRPDHINVKASSVVVFSDVI